MFHRCYYTLGLAPINNQIRKKKLFPISLFQKKIVKYPLFYQPPFSQSPIFACTLKRYYNIPFYQAPGKIFSVGRLFLGTTGALVALVSFKVNQFYEWSKDSLSDVIASMVTSFNETISFGDRLVGLLPSGTIWKPATKSKKTLGTSDSTPNLDNASISSENPANDSHSFPSGSSAEFSPLIRHLLELQEILRVHGLEDRLSLPTVVVLGGQSAGKTSVLEALIGCSFLPKGGSTMVTRRPLHLRLVHDPSAKQPFATFTNNSNLTDSKTISSSIGPLYDMGHVEAMLRALNSAVDESVGIDENPIYLSLHSSNLPDLALVDLPGFIQVSSRNQSPMLRDKIQKLADKYIQSPNVLLAVSPADVDLANSEALKSAREADPKGQRTIGVLSKLDLVSPEPEKAMSLMTKGLLDYPLPLGYVGLWAIPSTSLSGIPTPTGGISSLRSKLVTALENAMMGRLQSLYSGIIEELSEVELAIRVQFDSDIRVSPDAYLAKVLADTSTKIEALGSTELSKESIERALLTSMRQNISSSTLDGSAKDRIQGQEKLLNSDISLLTRSHIGKMASSIIQSKLIKKIEELAQNDPIFKLHPTLTTAAKSAIGSLLSSKLAFLTLSVEASVKPFRKGCEFSIQDWNNSKNNLLENLSKQIREIDNRILSLSESVGGHRRLKSIISTFSSKTEHSLSPYLIECAKEASSLHMKKEALEQRISFIKSSPSCTMTAFQEKEDYHQGISSWLWTNYDHGSLDIPLENSNKIKLHCPDVYLNLLAGRLANIAALYLHHEVVYSLLGSFRDQLTASVINNSSESNYTEPTISCHIPNASSLLHSSSFLPGSHEFASAALRFAEENPELAAQLKLQSKRDALTEVRDRLSYFLYTKAPHVTGR